MFRRCVAFTITAILIIASAGSNEGSYNLILYSPGISMEKPLWGYLRSGLNYVEAAGVNYPPDFLHPGGKAYGPLALTPIAIRDVFQHCTELSHYTVRDVLDDPILYEKVAKTYAYLLLRHYLKLEYWNIPRERLFEILQKAWFLGPGLYKKGLPIFRSREKMAKEYISKTKRAYFD